MQIMNSNNGMKYFLDIEIMPYAGLLTSVNIEYLDDTAN
jgi:hypothetical protein